jgi:hypothetical protein
MLARACKRRLGLGFSVYSRYSDSLRAGRSGARIPVGARFFTAVQTGPRVPGLFPGGKATGAWSGPHTPI